MLAGVVVIFGALGLFALVGVRAGGEDDLEQYLVARDTQSGWGLGLSFLASGLGAWMLFAPPEVGARVGLLGVVGYAVAVVAPLLALGLAGRRLRELMPSGHGLTEFVQARFGRTAHGAVIVITLLYMLVATVAELTAAGALLERLTGLDARIAILAVVVVTLAYTAYGGLRASLRTDRWQSWLLLALLTIVGIAVVAGIESPGAAIAGSGLLEMDIAGLEAAVTLVVAIVVTTLFNNGYWQRVWSATDAPALRQGVVVGSVLRVLPLLAVGLAGILAVGAGLDLGEPPVPFFALLSGQSDAVLLVVVLVAVALVASSVDTLENGMGALIATEWPRVSLRAARIATVVTMIPVTIAAFQGYSILRILLIADLLCAAAVVPVLLGLWSRATATGAIAGIGAGLAGSAVPALLGGAGPREALRSVTFPDAQIKLAPFAGALIVSTVVAVVAATLQRRTTDLDELRDHARRLEPNRTTERSP